jgi:aspartyl-tRNA(Asn)/glutamyl-tRNA(Gln) amidotransferase subunit C
MSRIGRAEVERIGHLARLRLDPEEADALARDLDAILGHVEELEAVDTSGVSAVSASGAERPTPLREDRAAPSLAVERALANAPDSDGGAFLVPPVLEGEDEGSG